MAVHSPRKLSKGQATRRRIVELAAPVFNRQGFVGASMRRRGKAACRTSALPATCTACSVVLWATRSRSSVVHDWPVPGTNCRSSVQARHVSGGASAGRCCVPQAAQMKASIGVLRL